MNEPDFEVRKLSEYSEQDLDDLYSAVVIAQGELIQADRLKKSLDLWAYRIKDAIKESKK